jgi:uncharacterized protein (TIGR02246 family)
MGSPYRQSLIGGLKMKATKRVIVALIWFAISSARFAVAMPQNSAPDAHEKDRAAIAQTVANFVSAWNIHNAHAFAATFTDDADFTNIAGVHAQGRANIEAFHAPMFASIFKDSRQTSTVRSIRFLTADLAAADVDCELTGAKAPDGSPRPNRKTLINAVMQKQSDGSWLILISHNSELTSFVAPPPAK